MYGFGGKGAPAKRRATAKRQARDGSGWCQWCRGGNAANKSSSKSSGTAAVALQAGQPIVGLSLGIRVARAARAKARPVAAQVAGRQVARPIAVQ